MVSNTALDERKRVPSHSRLRGDVNAAVLLTLVTAEYAYIYRNLLHLIVSMIGVAWATFVVRKWIVRRKRERSPVTRSLTDIVAVERLRIADSLFFLSPIAAGCLVLLGYLKRGREGFLAGLLAGVLYMVAVWLAERFPAGTTPARPPAPH
jgi:hypothetical protein